MEIKEMPELRVCNQNKIKENKMIITLNKNNMKTYKGKSGKLTIKNIRGKVLKIFMTGDVYPLYNTIKSLQKKESGTYAKLPSNFVAEFSPRKFQTNNDAK